MVDYPPGMWVDHILFTMGHIGLLVACILQICVAPQRPANQRNGGNGSGPNNTRRIFSRACLVLTIFLLYRPLDFWRTGGVSQGTSDAVFVVQDLCKKVLDIILVYCVTIFSYETTLNTFMSISLIKGTRAVPTLLLPGHTFIFCSTAAAEIGAAVASIIMDRTWPDSFMFCWLALMILLLCAMTVSTGLKLRAIMSTMTVGLLGDTTSSHTGLGRGSVISTPDQTRRAAGIAGIRSASSSQADWQRGNGSFGGIGSDSRGAIPGGGVPRSDSGISSSSRTNIGGRAHARTRDAGTILLRRLTRFFFLIGTVGPATAIYQIYFVVDKGESLMTQPLFGADTQRYHFAVLQWAHLLIGFVMIWFAWRPLKRTAEDDDLDDDDDVDIQIGAPDDLE